MRTNLRAIHSNSGEGVSGKWLAFPIAILFILFLIISIYLEMFIGLLQIATALTASLWILLLGGFTLKKTYLWRLKYFFYFSIALLFLWPRYVYIPIDALPTKNPQRMFYLLFICYWLTKMLTMKGSIHYAKKQIYLNRKIILLILVYFVWQIVSLLFSESPITSLTIVSVGVFEYLVPFFIVITVLRNIGDIDNFINVILFTTFIICIIGVIEAFVQHNLFESFIPAVEKNIEYLIQVSGSKFREGGHRVQSTFNHPVLLGEYLSLIIPLILYRFFVMEKKRIIMVFLFVLICFILIKTRARTGLAGLGIIVFFGTLLFNYRINVSKRYSKRLSYLLVPILIIIVPLAYYLLQALVIGRTSTESGSTMIRIMILKQGIPLFLEAPFFGYGPGFGAITLNFTNNYGQITLDNYYLLLLLDTGLPGLMSFLAVIAWGTKRGSILLLKAQNSRVWILGGMLSVSIIVFAAIKAILGTPHNFSLLFIYLGFLCVLSNSRQDKKVIVYQ